MSDNIILPRATVEQALEALELGYDSAKSEADQYHAAMAGYKPQRHAQMDADVQQIAAAIATLRAAQAQEQANPPGCDHSNHPLYAATKCRVCGRVTA